MPHPASSPSPSPHWAALALLLATCVPPQLAANPAGLDRGALQRDVNAIAARARPATIGVAVRDLATGDTWSLNGARRFPMQSVFKLALGAVVLATVDRGALSLADTIRLTTADLSPPYSAISARFPARTAYTVEELLVAAAGGSDNTAADVLTARVGGPAAVTRWLEANGVSDLRVDRYEREFQMELSDMPPFRPEWRTDSAFLRALHLVPAERRRAAAAAYLADPRDTATPIASVGFLEQLVLEHLLSPASTARLLRIATETTTGARRIRAGIPADATLAHKTGSARPDLGVTPAINDIGVVTFVDGRRVILAIYLAGSTLPYQQAESLLADVTRAVIAALR
ncbi:MAG: class A beta-lactamase [Gemmatimonadaceae bacterium]